MDLEKIESFFRISDKVLQKLSLEEYGRQIIEVLYKNYKDRLDSQNIQTQLEDTLKENINLKITINALQKTVDSLKEAEVISNRKYSENDTEKAEILKLLHITKGEKTEIENQLNATMFEKNNFKSNNDLLQGKISELLNELENKNVKISLTQEELNTSYEKQKILMQEIRNIKNGSNRVENNNSITELNKSFENIFSDNQKIISETIEQYNEKIYRLESELSSASIELKCRDKQLKLINEEANILKSHKSSLQIKINHYNNKLNLVENNFDDLCSSLDHRMQIIEKFYKSQYNVNLEASKKLTKYLKIVEELKNKLLDSELEKNSINERLHAVKNDKKLQIRDYEEKVKVLEKELEIVKLELVQNPDESINATINSEILTHESILRKFSPIAVNTSSNLRSGLTLSDIYAEYTQTRSQLHKVTNESNFAAKQLKKLISEKDSLSKLLEENKTERNEFITVNNALTKRLNESRLHIVELGAQIKDLNKTILDLKTQVEIGHNVKIDLNGQIKNLLCRIEILKSNNGYLNNDEPALFPFFNSISELQNINIQLLEIVHQQEVELESKKSQSIDENINENSQILLEARDTKLKQTERILEITSQQRDMFKILYQNSSGIGVNDSIKIDIDDITYHESGILLQENTKLKEELDAMGQRIKELKNDFNIERNSLLSRIEKSEKLFEDLNNKADELFQKNQFLNDALRANENKIQQYKEINVNLEIRIKGISEEKDRIYEEHKAIKKLHYGLICENDSLKRMISNIQIENKSLIDERSNLKPFMDQLQDMSIQIQRSEFLFKSELVSPVHDLEKCIKDMKNQFSDVTSQLKAEKSEISSDLNMIKAELIAEKTEHMKTKEKLEISFKSLEKMSKSIKDSNSEIDLNVKDFQDEHNSQIIDLNSQIEQYKSICNSTETRLAEISLDYENLNKGLQEAQIIIKNERENHSQTVQELKNECFDLRKKLELADSNIRDSDICDQHISKIDQLMKENADLSDLYSKSVVNHGDSLKKINELNEYISNLENKISQSVNKITNLEEDLNLSHQRLLEKCKEIEIINKKEKESNFSKVEETSLLYKQIESLREQLNRINDVTKNQSSFMESSVSCTNEEVWKLLEYTRNEKTILQGRIDHYQAEIARLNTKSAQLYQTIKTIELNLEDERNLRLSQGKLEEIEKYKKAVDSQENLEKEIVNLTEKIKRYEHKISEITEIQHNTESKCENLIEQLHNLQDNYEKKFANMDENTKQLTLARQGLDHYKKLIIQLKSQLSETQKFKSASLELEKCKEIIEQLKSKELSSLNTLQSLNNEIENLKKVVSNKVEENKRLEHRSKILTERLLSKMSEESDKNPQILQQPISAKDSTITQSLNTFNTTSEIENTQLLNIAPRMRRKIAPNIPSKIQPGLNVLQRQDALSAREQLTSQEYFEKSDTQTGFDKSEIVTDLEEGELVAPFPIVFQEKRQQRTEIKPPSIPSKGTSNSSSSRFGLIRNILKTDNVISSKTNLQTIEPPSINRFNSILNSQIKKSVSDSVIQPTNITFETKPQNLQHEISEFMSESNELQENENKNNDISSECPISAISKTNADIEKNNLESALDLIPQLEKIQTAEIYHNEDSGFQKEENNNKNIQQSIEGSSSFDQQAIDEQDEKIELCEDKSHSQNLC